MLPLKVLCYSASAVLCLAWLLPKVSPLQRLLPLSVRSAGPRRLHILGALALALLASSIVVIPAGQAGVVVSQVTGVRPDVLTSGIHLVPPLIDEVALYDVKDRILGGEGEFLKVQSKEGLNLSLAISVRYRLDPARLPLIHKTLPEPLERQVVSPVVASAFRQLLPNFMVRDIFATEREAIRGKAFEIICKKLGDDGVLVEEVMLRDVVLPAEYAKGLEGLLLRQQQNERMVYDIEIKQKEVRTAELEAEGQKARQVKAAEAAAEVQVLQAKAEADAMQYTLPFKQKQIEQTRLEAEARKEASLKDADAQAQVKIIDAKAEAERRGLLAAADAQKTRIMAAAETERMKLESDILLQNPLLIQKIVAERLSDKMQIMMVPMDGQNFFATDVLRSSLATAFAQRDPAKKEGSQEPTIQPSPARAASASTQQRPAGASSARTAQR